MEGTVEAIVWNGKPSIVVPGYLHGPLRRKHLFLGSSVRVVIAPEIVEKREACLKQIRARTAPLKLLQESVRNSAREHESTDVENVAKGIGGIIVDNSPSLPARSSFETVGTTELIANLGYHSDRTGKSNLKDELKI